MKEVEELYGKMLAVFEEKTGFTMDEAVIRHAKVVVAN